MYCTINEKIQYNKKNQALSIHSEYQLASSFWMISCIHSKHRHLQQACKFVSRWEKEHLSTIILPFIQPVVLLWRERNKQMQKYFKLPLSKSIRLGIHFTHVSNTSNSLTLIMYSRCVELQFLEQFGESNLIAKRFYYRFFFFQFQ